MKDFQAPAACLYNKTSKDYVLAVGKALWSTRRRPGSTRGGRPLSRQISAAAFDVPRERRVVLGTENGEVLVVNYISGEVISKIGHTRAKSWVSRMVVIRRGASLVLEGTTA